MKGSMATTQRDIRSNMTRSRLFAAAVLLALFLGAALLPAPARAQLFGRDLAKPGLTLAVFESGRVMVRDVRDMDLPQGQGSFLVTDVASSLEPGSLQVRSLTAPGKLAVESVNLQPGLDQAASLLERYVGLTVRVVLPLGGDKLSEPMDADLLSAREPYILRTAEGLYVGPVHSFLLLESEGWGTDPRLTIEADNQGPLRQLLELSYLASGLSWRADYRLDLDQGGDTGRLSAWATLNNGLDIPLHGVNLVLVSGDLNRVATEPLMAYAMDESAGMRMENSMKAAPMPMPQESTAFAYHVYELGRPVDLDQGTGNQLALFPSAKVQIKRQLVSTFGDFYMNRTPEPLEQGVEVRLTLANDTDKGPGRALPAGVVRVFQARESGVDLLVGEESMGHQPLGQDIVLTPGRSFDVTVTRLLESYEKLGERGAVMTWAITAHNGGEKAEDLLLEDNMPGEWKVRTADAEYERKSATTLAFSLNLEPGQEQTVKYTVEIKY